MAVYWTPRMRRLDAEYKAMQELKKQSSILDFKAFGDPPERYVISFKGKGLVKDADGVKISKHHEAEVKLGADYPRVRPDVKWLTPIHHPNIFTGAVCLGKFSLGWVPSFTLVEFVEVLWDMVRMAILNPKSAGPGGGDESEHWGRIAGKFGLPVDKRPLRDLVLRPDDPSSIVRPEGGEDIVIIDESGLCDLTPNGPAGMDGLGTIAEEEVFDFIMAVKDELSFGDDYLDFDRGRYWRMPNPEFFELARAVAEREGIELGPDVENAIGAQGGIIYFEDRREGIEGFRFYGTKVAFGRAWQKIAKGGGLFGLGAHGGAPSMKEVVRIAKQQGWQVGQTAKGHWKFIPPDPTKPIVIGPGTPSDWRSMRNFLAQMRRSGFVWVVA